MDVIPQVQPGLAATLLESAAVGKYVFEGCGSDTCRRHVESEVSRTSVAGEGSGVEIGGRIGEFYPEYARNARVAFRRGFDIYLAYREVFGAAAQQQDD